MVLQYTGKDGLTYVWNNDVLTVRATGSNKAITAMSYCTLTCSDDTVVNLPSTTTKIVLDGVTSVCNYAFYSSRSYPAHFPDLDSITFGKVLTTIGDYAFGTGYDYNNLNLIILPSTITHIGEWAFSRFSVLNHVALRSVYIYASNPPTLFGRTGFNRGHTLGILSPSSVMTQTGTVYVPSNSVSAYQGADGWRDFYGYISAISDVKDSNNNLYVMVGTTLTISKGESGTGVISNFSTNVSDLNPSFADAEKVIIEEGVTKIGNKAFDSMEHLTEIHVPSSVTNIGDSACLVTSSANLTLYLWCSTPPTLGYTSPIATAIKEIMVPANTLSSYLSNSSFRRYADKIHMNIAVAITCPSGVTADKESGEHKVGNAGFTVTFTNSDANPIGPSSVKIGARNITQYTWVSDDNRLTIPASSFSYSGTLDIVIEKTYPKYYDANNNEYYVDGEGRLIISRNNGTGVTPDLLNSQNVFTVLGIPTDNVRSVVVRDTITSLGENTFNSCYAGSTLADVRIEEAHVYAETIGDHAFDSCMSLMHLYLYPDVTEIGDYAFYNCTSLTDVKMAGTLTDDPELSSLGIGAFKGCRQLYDFDFPKGTNNITALPESVFEGCDFGYFILDGITSIGDNAYKGVMWKSLVVPKSVSSIGASAFDDGTRNAKSVYVSNATPATLSYDNNDCFGRNANDVRIYVDTSDGATVEGYETQWVQYSNSVVLDTSFYAIHFVKNAVEAAGSMKDVEAHLNIPVKLPHCSFTWKDHAMIRWCTRPQGSSGTFYDDMATITMSEKIKDLYLYAQWGEAYANLVTFDPVEGKIVSGDSKVLTNDSGYVDAFPVVTRSGYVFAGWYTSLEYTTQFTRDTPVRDGDITVYARWTEAYVEEANVCTLIKNHKGDQGQMIQEVIKMPYVKSFTDTYSASLTTLDTIIYGYENKYVMDLGTQEKYVFEFERVSPPAPYDGSDDQEQWSNGKWFTNLINFFNDWQNLNYDDNGALAGGVRLQFAPGSQYKSMFPNIDKNVFLSGSISADHGVPQTLQKLSFSMTFAVGSMAPTTDRSTWMLNFKNTKVSGSQYVETGEEKTISSPMGAPIYAPQYIDGWGAPSDKMFMYWSFNKNETEGEVAIYPGTELTYSGYDGKGPLYPRWSSSAKSVIFTLSDQPFYEKDAVLTMSIEEMWGEHGGHALQDGDRVTLNVVNIGGGGSGGSGNMFRDGLALTLYGAGGGGGSGQLESKTYSFIYHQSEGPRFAYCIGPGGGGFYRGISILDFERFWDGQRTYSYVERKVNGAYAEISTTSFEAGGGTAGHNPGKGASADNAGFGGEKYAEGGNSGYAGSYSKAPASYSVNDIRGGNGKCSGDRGVVGKGRDGDAHVDPNFNVLTDLRMGGGGGGAANFRETVNGTTYQSMGGNGGLGGKDDVLPTPGLYGGGGGGSGVDDHTENKRGGNGLVFIKMQVT